MYRYIQKTIDWGVKIASLAVTGPATWVVATELFADITDPILLFIMRACAVFLIEGVLISNWLLLEFDKDATPEIKMRYGVTAMAMYISLLVIAWKHEGPTGLVFRVALLAALIGSGWDTYVITWQKTMARVDRSAEAAWEVRSHNRKLSIKEAIMRRNAEHRATVALLSAQSEASLEQNSLYGQRLVASIRLEDKRERLQLMEEEAGLDGNGNGNGKKKPTLLPQLQSQRASLSPVISQPGQIMAEPFSEDPSHRALQLKHNILGAFAEDPRYTAINLAEKFGVPIDEVVSSMDELIADGRLLKQGRRYLLPEEDEMLLGNGGRRLRVGRR
jgi:hypothetical protein